MDYTFKRKSDWIIVEVTGDNDTLSSFSNSDWNLPKLQEIIDGVKATQDTDEEYRWANEDIMVISNKHAVFFIDLLSSRGNGNKAKDKQDLDLTHEAFLNFLEDFKKFIG